MSLGKCDKCNTELKIMNVNYRGVLYCPNCPKSSTRNRGVAPSNDKEGKFIIDRPLRVKSCLRCWTPLRYKDNRLYCSVCGRYRTAKTSHWIDEYSNIRFVTEEKMNDAINKANEDAE